MAANQRTISVDGQTFHWRVGTRSRLRGTPEREWRHVAVWAAEKDGQRLNIQIRYDDGWLSPVDPVELRPLLPAEVRALILEALDHGWTPRNRRGTDLFFLADRDTHRLEATTKAEYDDYKRR